MAKEEKDFKYIKNGPCDHEDYDEYARVLDEKINDNDVHNIGIISPYGGGKSSLLLRYKKHYAGQLNKRIKTVSLANFVENENNDDEIAIEKSVLEQLLYEAKHSTLPNSSIKRIHSRIGYLIAASTLTFILIIIFALGYLIWNRVILQESGSDIINVWKVIILTLFLLVSAALIITLIMSARLVKIKYREIELDFLPKDGNNSQSILNSFIDELIYYFKQTKARVVIFEDIDRFKSFNIFSKLRELNTILNENEELKMNKITFVYAINDGLFKDAEGRSKFFDYIISLLPIMNSNNSRDFMYSGIGNSICGKALGLDEVFISDISKYITDIRVLKNTLNDCLLYKQVLGLKDKSDLEKIFALMVYKNLMPEDFHNLQKEKGILYNLLNSEKEKAINEYINRSSNRFKEIDEKIDSLRNDSSILNDFRELKNYVAGILFQNGADYQNQNVGYVDLSSLETFENIAKGVCVRKSINETYYGTKQHTFGMSIQELNERLGTSIADLESKIAGKNNEAIAALKSEKIALEKSISSIRVMSIHDLIKNGIYVPTIASFNEGDEKSESDVKNKMMLINMLSKGYIDYSYRRMLTKSNNDILSTGDKNIFYCITSNQAIDPDATIDNPKMLINDLKDYMFLNEKVFNYSLIAYLFDNTGNEKKKQNFIDMISKRNDASKKFLINYCSKGYSIKKFLLNCKNTYKELIFDILLNSDDREVKNIVVSELLSLENIDLIKIYNKDNVLSNWLSDCKSLIETFAKAASAQFICDVLKDLSVVVKEIDYYQEYAEEEKNIFKFVVDNSLYDISISNINKISRFYLGSPQVNISCFFLTDKAVKDNFSNHINEFVGLIIESSESLDETDATIDYVLKNESISFSNKKGLIKKMNKAISYSLDYQADLLNELVNSNKLIPNWNTIELLFKLDNTNAIIQKHIEDNIEYYENTECNSEDILVKLANEIDIAEETLSTVTKSFKCNILPSSIVDDKKCSLLVENKLIASDEQNMFECLDRPSVLEAMINANDCLIANLKGQAVPMNSTVFLIKSKKIDNNKKHLIIMATQNTIVIGSFELAKLMLSIISGKNNDGISEKVLIDIYNLVIEKIDKETIKNIGYTYLKGDDLITFAMNVEKETIQSIILSDTVKISKTDFENNALYQALLKSSFISIAHRGKVNYSIDVKNLKAKVRV